MDKENSRAIEQLVQLGENKIKQIEIMGAPYVVMPSSLKMVNFDELLEKPRYISCHSKFTSVQSFIAYFNRFATEHSTIFIDRATQRDTNKEPTMVAIFDHHEATDKPLHAKHLATLELRLSDEWKDWKRANDKFTAQEDFATFVEDHAVNFIDPESAQMMEIALSLQAKTGVEFQQSKRMTDGTHHIHFKETMDAKAGQSGDLEIPQNLTLALKVFEGITEPPPAEPPEDYKAKIQRYQLDGKFRFQIREHRLSLKYKLLNLDAVYDHAVDQLAEFARRTITTGHVYEGTF